MIRTYLMKHRKQNKKSLNAMAEELCVSRNYYNLLEKGKKGDKMTLATAYKIWEVPFCIVPPKTLLITKTVIKIPIMGKIPLINPNFQKPVKYVAKEKTQCAKVFNTITANAEEIPTNTADKNINCLGDNKDCAIAIIISNLEMNFLNIINF